MGSTDNLNNNNKKEEMRGSGRPHLRESGLDPSARKRFEETLRTSESFLNSILDQSPYPMWIADDRGTLVWLNQACRDLLYLEDNEVVGKYNILKDNIVEEQGLLPLVKRVFEEGEAVRFELKYDSSHLKQLQVRHAAFVILDVTMFPIRDASGKIAYAMIQHLDITERKRAEEELRKEKLLTEAILDSLPGTFFIMDAQGKTLRTNTSGQIITGYSSEEISKMQALEFIVEEDKPAVQRAMAEVFEKGEASVEAQMLTKDGRKIPFLFTAHQFIIDRTPCLLGTGVDITERKRAEEALREREKQFRSEHSLLRALIDSIPDLIFFKDRDSVYLGCNQAFEAYAGMGESELIGRNDLEIASQKVAKFFRRRDREMLASGEAQLNEEWIPFKDGGGGFFETLKTPYYGPDGELLGLIGVSRDITSRKEAEEALRESEERYRSLFQNHHAVMLLVDPETGAIMDANPAACAYYGFSKEELLTKTTADLNTLTQDQVFQAMQRAKAEEQKRFEFQHRLANGEIRDVEIFSGPIRVKGQELLYSIIHDVTARKRAQEALRESEKKYRSLYLEFQGILNAIPDLLCLLSPDLKIVWSNEASVVATRKGRAADLLGKSCYAIRHQSSEPCENCPVLRCFRSGQIETDERTGEGNTWELRAVPIYDDQGELVGAVELARNITERKQMMEALRESQTLYQDLVETAQDLIWQCDSEGRYTYLNPAWEEVFGYKIEEMLGKRFSDFQPPESAARDKQEFARLLEGNIVKRLETVHLAKDGRELHLVFNAKFVRDQDGRIIGTRGTAYNITERKKAEEGLRESRKKYRSLYQEFQGILNTIPDILCLLSPDLRIVWGNEATAQAIPGRQLSEIIGEHCYPLRHERSEPCENCPVLRCFSSGKIETEEVVSFGEPWELRAVPLYDDQGELRGAIEVARNITERKRMEEALEKRLVALSRPLDDTDDIDFNDLFNLQDIQRIQDLFAESTGVASLITTPDGTPITQPSSFCRLCSSFIRQTEQGRKRCATSDAALWRYKPDGPTIHHCLSAGLCGAGASITVGGKHIANWLIGQVRDGTQTEEDMRNYARELGLDAEEFIDAFREVPIMSEDHFQQVAQALFIFANQLSAMAYQNVQQARFITEGKRMEEALRDSERRLSEIIDFLPDATFAIDLEGKVIAWNRAIEDMTGVQAEDIIGKGDYAYAVPFYGVRRPILIDLVFRPDAEVEKKYVFVNRQGDILLAEADVPLKGEMHLLWGKARPLYDSEGNVVGAIEAIRDITERKEAEEERARLEAQMREVQKLESLGVLAGGIAHDFNNLLMAVLGNADLALTSLSLASPARPNVEEIVRASHRAADLCRQMLAYSGKGRFVVGPYDLSEIVQEMTQMLEVSVSKKATLRYFFGADLPAVEADATQLRQVIMNLITNASEALGDQSGVISISTGVMDCDRAYFSESYLDENLPEGRYVFLEVADTGDGMDEETRRRIFEPFFTTKFTGRGLGLAAVLGIVRGHHGAIKVYSEPGKGTSFKVLFPATAWTPEGQAPRKVRSAPRLSGGTILLVDDDPEVRKVGLKILKRLGFKVLTAAHGREGLEIFRASKGEIDGVILDLTMPEMGGEEVFRELRRLRKDVRVILSSGYSEQEVIQRFAGKRIAGFIQKPYTLKMLRETLERVFRAK